MVAVLGMPVGKVSKVTSKGSYVEAELTVDKKVKIPAAVRAVTITTSILTDRQVELTPPYRSGPVLKNHDTIGLTRTKTPVAFDRVLDMLDKVSKSLKGRREGRRPGRRPQRRGRRHHRWERQEDPGRPRRAFQSAAPQFRAWRHHPRATDHHRHRPQLDHRGGRAQRRQGARVRLHHTAAQPDPGRREVRHWRHRADHQPDTRRSHHADREQSRQPQAGRPQRDTVAKTLVADQRVVAEMLDVLR